MDGLFFVHGLLYTIKTLNMKGKGNLMKNKAEGGLDWMLSYDRTLMLQMWYMTISQSPCLFLVFLDIYALQLYSNMYKISCQVWIKYLYIMNILLCRICTKQLCYERVKRQGDGDVVIHHITKMRQYDNAQNNRTSMPFRAHERNLMVFYPFFLLPDCIKCCIINI